MIFLPIPIEIENLEYVGSSVVDTLVDVMVWFYDALSGTGSSTDMLSSVSAS